MGMLSEARKKDSKSASDKEHLKPDPKRKHKHAKPSPEIAGNAPGVETASDADPSGDSQPDATDDGGPQPDADQTQPDSDADGGDASSQPPQQPQASPSADDADQGEQEDDSQGGSAQAPDQQPDGDQQDQSAQNASPPGGDDEDSDDASSGPAGQPAGGPQGNSIDLSQIPISPALKEEYIRCNAALYTALYKNDKVANAVMKGIVPQGPHKIESVARMSLLLFTQINKQLSFVKDTPQVVLPFARDIAEHVLDLAVNVKKIQFTDQESQAAIGALLELVQRVVGVTHGNIKALKHIIPRSQLADAHNKYQQHLQYIKGARGANANAGAPQSPGNPGGAPQQGQPDQSQGGAPASASPPGGQPQAGAPVTAAPGPGQSAPPGGMLSAAAAPGGGQ
jgi:hypothetical protein